MKTMKTMRITRNKTICILIISTFVFFTISLGCKTSDNIQIQSVKVNEPGINSITDAPL